MLNTKVEKFFLNVNQSEDRISNEYKRLNELVDK